MRWITYVFVGVFALAVAGCTRSGEVISGARGQPVSPQEAVEAALGGDDEVMARALANGCPVDGRDEAGRTLLMYAAYNGRTAVVRRLLDAGADVNACDPNGTTVLMFAASGANFETVRVLLERDLAIDAVDDGEHFSALMWAASEGQAAVVDALLQKGADWALKDVDGDTAEVFARRNGHIEVAARLQRAREEMEAAQL